MLERLLHDRLERWGCLGGVTNPLWSIDCDSDYKSRVLNRGHSVEGDGVALAIAVTFADLGSASLSGHSVVLNCGRLTNSTELDHLLH